MDSKICQLITDRVTVELSKGVIPWRRPWTGSDACISHSTGKAYSLLNQILLGRPGEWLTFNQCSAEGGKIKHGEHGRPAVFWKQAKVIDAEHTDDNGDPLVKYVPVLRYYTLFNIDQCTGIKPKYDRKPMQHAEPIAEAEAIITRYRTAEPALRISAEEITGRAYYSPSKDLVSVPSIAQYEQPTEFYSTLFHELVHSTGHESRLSRFTSTAAVAAFGSETYSREELIAEIGAAALCSTVGIETPDSFKNSAAYIQSWLKALHDDPTMIITAAGRAEKAISYVLGTAAAE